MAHSTTASAARIEQAPYIPAGAREQAPGLPLPPPVEDGRLVAYNLAARPVYDGLRRASAQLAGVLVLAQIGGTSAQDHPMVTLARDVHAQAADALRAMMPPPRAAHHHKHLVAASTALAEALAVAKDQLHRAGTEGHRLSRPVSSAIDHLRWAGQLLPGFEIVDFSQGCACHPGLAYQQN